jgi:hypothetical protein
MANIYPPPKPTPRDRLRLAWAILVNPFKVFFNLNKTAVNNKDSETSHSVFCFYKNEVKQIQILRIVDENHYCHFEQVIFPTQQLLFATPPKVQLEVYTGTFIATVLTDKLTCEDLEIKVSDRAIA